MLGPVVVVGMVVLVEVVVEEEAEVFLVVA